MAAEPADSRDPRRSPAMTRPTASFSAHLDGGDDTDNSSEPSWDWAIDCSHEALLMCHRDGDIKKARDLFRRVLSCGAGARPGIVFHAWIGMEAGHGDAAAVRACFEEWCSRAGGCRGDTEFWRLYAAFELRRQHGPSSRRRARPFAEAAMEACPRNPVVFAMCCRVELRLGCHGRARAVVRNARDTFTGADEDAARWVEDELVRYHSYLREAAAWPTTIGDLFRSLLFCDRGGALAQRSMVVT